MMDRSSRVRQIVRLWAWPAARRLPLTCSWVAQPLESWRGRSAKHPVQMAPVGDALELVLAGVLKHQPRARSEVFHRGTHQNLPRVGERADPRADVDRQAADAVTGEFDLAGVA